MRLAPTPLTSIRLAVLCSVIGAAVVVAPGSTGAAASAAAPNDARLLTATPAPSALAEVDIDRDQVELDFPESLTFHLELSDADAVTRVVLEYGVEQLTCSTVVAKAFPDFTPDAEARVSWTWEMLQSGSQPPGARIWWRWRLLSAAGGERVTERQMTTWLDDRHDWKTISEAGVSLHWYTGGRSFGEGLHEAALGALTDLAVTPGLLFDGAVDLYIYGDTEALQEAVLYEPGWTGGLAYAEHSIVIIGVAPDQLAWGRRTVAHELTHVLVGHFTFSCLGYVPTWLNEGLAVYAEGGPEPQWAEQLETAIAEDVLIPVEALNGGFSEDPQQADLSYVQSYSLVNFLIETYGAESLLELLTQLRDGFTVEAALRNSYGFGLAGLEQEWRAAIGARPLVVADVTPAPVPTATIIPTIVPLDGIPAGPTVAPTRVRPPAQATVAPRGDLTPAAPRAGLAAGIILICCLTLLAGVGALSVVAIALGRRGRRR